MTRRTRLLFGALVVLASTSLATPARADDTAYCSNPTNNHIMKLDFVNDTATQVNTDAALRRQLVRIAVRDDVSHVHLIAADFRASRILFYEDAQGRAQVIATQIRNPVGLSLDGLGNIYVVGANPRVVSRLKKGPQVWMIPRGGTRPGGYGTPVLVQGDLPSSRLADVRVYPADAGTLTAGDLLVVSEYPARIFRYPAAGAGFGPRETLVPPSSFPVGARPSGIAFAPNGELLVVIRSGKVLRFDSSGGALSPDFATGIPPGMPKISVAVQEGVVQAFVASGSTVSRFVFLPDGSGSPNGSLNACGGGSSVSVASDTGAITPVGTNVRVRPVPEVEIEFDNVTVAGITTASMFEFVDNRPGAVDQGLRAFFPGDPVLQAQLTDVTIPSYFQAFPKKAAIDPPGGPYTGPPTFVMGIIDTTATFTRTAQMHEEEEGRLGYAPSCADATDPGPPPQPQASQPVQPRTFYAPETDAPKSEAPLLEGTIATDFSSGCGSNIGRSSRFSFWFTGRDTRNSLDIANNKFDSLGFAIGTFYAGLINSATAAILTTQLGDARTAFDAGDLAGTILSLNLFIATVDGNPGSFTPDPANVAGELIARAESLKYIVPKVPGVS